MGTTRYKISKEQLERVVENFVMEAASIESKKAPVKNMIPSQGSEAKKHVKNKIAGSIVKPSDGVPMKPPTMKKKLSQSADAKKFVSNSKGVHSNKAKVVKEEKQLLDESIMDIMGQLHDFISNIDISQEIQIMEGESMSVKEFITGVLMALAVPVTALALVFGKDISDKGKGIGQKFVKRFGKDGSISKMIQVIKQKLGV